MAANVESGLRMYIYYIYTCIHKVGSHGSALFERFLGVCSRLRLQKSRHQYFRTLGSQMWKKAHNNRKAPIFSDS